MGHSSLCFTGSLFTISEAMRICTSLQQFTCAPTGFRFLACKPFALSKEFPLLSAATKGAEKWMCRLPLHQYPIDLSLENRCHLKNLRLVRGFQKEGVNNKDVTIDDEESKDNEPSIDAENVNEALESGPSRRRTQDLAETGNFKAERLTVCNNGRVWWKFWEGFSGRKGRRVNEISSPEGGTADPRSKSRKRYNEATTTEAPNLSTTKKEPSRGLDGPKDRKQGWKWLMGFTEEAKKALDTTNGDLNDNLAIGACDFRYYYISNQVLSTGSFSGRVHRNFALNQG